MLINLSNHPSAQWPEPQRRQALDQYGAITDLEFPQIPPDWPLSRVQALAQDYIERCIQLQPTSEQPPTIHIMGEMTFTYQFVKMAEARGLPCVAATTTRVVEKSPDGGKISRFEFVRFRPYFDDHRSAKTTHPEPSDPMTF